MCHRHFAVQDIEFIFTQKIKVIVFDASACSESVLHVISTSFWNAFSSDSFKGEAIEFK